MLSALLIAHLVAAPAAPPQPMYRATVDALTVEVGNSRSLEVELGKAWSETGHIAILPGGVDVAVRAADRVSKKTSRATSFVTSLPGSPARIRAKTTIPYTNSRLVHGGLFGTQVVTEYKEAEAGTDLRVTMTPAGGKNVRVDIETVESAFDSEPFYIPGRSDSRSFIPAEWLAPRKTDRRLLTSVIVPVGGTIVLGGLPIETRADNTATGIGFELSGKGMVVRSRDNADVERESVFLLTVTEESPAAPAQRDELIERFFKRVP